VQPLSDKSRKGRAFINIPVISKRCTNNKRVGSPPIEEVSDSPGSQVPVVSSQSDAATDSRRLLVRIRCSVCDKVAVYLCLGCQRVSYCSIACQVCHMEYKLIMMWQNIYINIIIEFWAALELQ
jgi:hypothetical protein